MVIKVSMIRLRLNCLLMRSVMDWLCHSQMLMVLLQADSKLLMTGKDIKQWTRTSMTMEQ